MSDNAHDAEYSLVMPFVVTSDNGGPYDSESYTAGCEFGSLNRMLEMLPPEVLDLSLTVRSGNVSQFDLAAMHHGWRIDSEPWADDDEWSFLILSRRSTDDEVEAP